MQGLPGIRWPSAIRALLIALLCAVSLTTIACGDDDDDSGSSNGSGSAAQTPEEPAPEEPQPTEPEQQAEGGCQEVAQPEPRQDGGAKRPSGRLDPDATYIVTLETSCGDIAIRLDQRTSPKTTASFAHLARTGFYDGTVFHRIVPGFVIQGGDPTQTGAGGPGYSTVDVPPQDAAYTYGTVAMAKTATEPPGTSGSQFFVVTAPDAGLPPEYAVVGTISAGLDVVDVIGMLGDQEQRPTQTVLIEKVTVTER